MKRLVSCLAFLLLIGCASQAPIPAGAARVRVHVVAKAKEGVKHNVERVAVYDAVPKAAKAPGEYERVDYANLGDIIIWLKGAKDFTPTSQPMIQLNPNESSPAVTPAYVGGTAIVHNPTTKSVSVYSVSEGNEFETVIQPGGSFVLPVKSEGLIEILVDPSRPPVALMYAAPSAYAKRAHAGETVTFDVPPGRYNVVSWHPRLPAGETHVDAIAGQSIDCALSVGVSALSSSSK